MSDSSIVIQKAFALDERICAVKWTGEMPLLIIRHPSGQEEDMEQLEYKADSPTDLVFEELWDFFLENYGEQPVCFNRIEPSEIKIQFHLALDDEN